MRRYNEKVLQFYEAIYFTNLIVGCPEMKTDKNMVYNALF
jgi:hypothetical protein